MTAPSRMGCGMIVERILMTRTFNTVEVFEIAEQIERNGAAFYRRAAELFEESDISTLFINLADWELRHEVILANMRKQLSGWERGVSIFDVEDTPLDAKAMAGLGAFGIGADPAEQLSGSESRSEVLQMALQKEKDTVVYYTGLKSFVSDAIARDKIDDIVEEELRHIRIITQAIEQCE